MNNKSISLHIIYSQTHLHADNSIHHVLSKSLLELYMYNRTTENNLGLGGLSVY